LLPRGYHRHSSFRHDQIWAIKPRGPPREDKRNRENGRRLFLNDFACFFSSVLTVSRCHLFFSAKPSFFFKSWQTFPQAEMDQQLFFVCTHASSSQIFPLGASFSYVPGLVFENPPPSDKQAFSVQRATMSSDRLDPLGPTRVRANLPPSVGFFSGDFF